MTPHIEAKKGEIADCVLLPGDPLRAKWLAETYLTDVQCYNRVRNMFGYTGIYKGQRISVQGSGMGIPSLSIYVYELLNHYDVKTVMRVGSCGGMQSSLSLGDIILAMTASTDSAINRQKFGAIDYAPVADWHLLNTAYQLSRERSLPVHVGGIMSGDRFYTDDPKYLSKITQHGVLAVEMETSAFYKETVAGLDGDGREFFKSFVQVEEGHLALVEAEIDSVTGMGFWFDTPEFNLENA